MSPVSPDVHKLKTVELLEVLRGETGIYRGDAAVELALRGIQSAWKPICSLLEDPFWPARCDAADALDILQSRRSVPYLRRALKTKNAVVKGYVAETLASLGDAGSKPVFVRMTKSRSERVRLHGEAALYVLGDDGRLSDVIRFLAGPDYRIKCASSSLLSRIVRRPHIALAKRGLAEAIRTEKNAARIADFKRTLKELSRR